MKKLLAVCFLTISNFISCADNELARQLPNVDLSRLLEENETVSLGDSNYKRLKRNVARCSQNPCEFYALGFCGSNSDIEHALLKHVMQQHLTLNGQPVLDAPHQREMKEEFRENQKKAIREYVVMMQKSREKSCGAFAIFACISGLTNPVCCGLSCLVESCYYSCAQ